MPRALALREHVFAVSRGSWHRTAWGMPVRAGSALGVGKAGSGLDANAVAVTSAWAWRDGMGNKSGGGMSRRDFLRQVAAGAAAAAAAGAGGSGAGRGAEGDRAEPGRPPGGSRSAAELPEGVRAVWELGKADQQMTPTRARVCINGLWRWQPGREASEAIPTGNWGYFKVPGCWPGITDYMQKDCQTVYPHPSWREEDLREITAAWYEREVTIPRDWAGRRIALHVEYLNSYAAVYVDGAKVGELRFPSGELDLTSACRPGETSVLSVLVEAMPLKGVMLAFNDTASARASGGGCAGMST